MQSAELGQCCLQVARNIALMMILCQGVKQAAMCLAVTWLAKTTMNMVANRKEKWAQQVSCIGCAVTAITMLAIWVPEIKLLINEKDVMNIGEEVKVQLKMQEGQVPPEGQVPHGNAGWLEWVNTAMKVMTMTLATKSAAKMARVPIAAPILIMMCTANMPEFKNDEPPMKLGMRIKPIVKMTEQVLNTVAQGATAVAMMCEMIEEMIAKRTQEVQKKEGEECKMQEERKQKSWRQIMMVKAALLTRPLPVKITNKIIRQFLDDKGTVQEIVEAHETDWRGVMDVLESPTREVIDIDESPKIRRAQS